MATSEERLIELGLTSYEAKAYLALVRRDSSVPADVARLSGIPRQRIYDVLHTLVEKGLASHRPGPPAKYAAVSPEYAIERLLLARREELDRVERTSREMIELLVPAFAAGQKERDPLDYIEVLRDSAAINERFDELQRNIQDEILIFTKPPYAKPAQDNVEGLALLREHRARSVYEYSALDDDAFADAVRVFIAAGEEARFVEQLPLKLVIIDETIVMFGMEDPVAGPAELTIVVVDHKALARILKIAFESVWSTGLTIDELEAKRDDTGGKSHLQLA
ncbi:MAG TPA: helix-turn-helix domain-containing protein [Gaiellaceae bacterium]|nr:helix-turn-helix domain-containing protein [Gaiellaceae bacterium]